MSDDKTKMEASETYEDLRKHCTPDEVTDVGYAICLLTDTIREMGQREDDLPRLVEALVQLTQNPYHGMGPLTRELHDYILARLRGEDGHGLDGVLQKFREFQARAAEGSQTPVLSKES